MNRQPQTLAFRSAIFSLAVVAWGSVASAQLNSLLEERGRIVAVWQSEREAGRLETAIALAEQLIALDRTLLEQPQSEQAENADLRTDASQNLENTLDWLASHFEEQGDARALALRQEVMHLSDARLAREDAQQLAELSDAQRRQLVTAEELYQQGEALFNEHQYADALEKYSASLKGFEDIVGSRAGPSRKARSWIAYLYKKLGDYPHAKEAYEQELALNQEIFGLHTAPAQSLHSLATVLEFHGDLSQAKARYEESLDLRQRVWGPEHVRTALAHNDLGLIYMWTGDYAAAKPQLERSFEIIRDLPNFERNLAANLQNQALLHSMMGDYTSAEPLYQASLKHAAGQPDVLGQILDNVGLLYSAMDQHENAIGYFKRALAAYELLDVGLLHDLVSLDSDAVDLDATDPAVGQKTKRDLQAALVAARVTQRETLRKIANAHNNYAWANMALEQYEEGERRFERSLAISRAIDGEKRPEVAACLDNLGRLHEARGMNDFAEQEYEQALAIRTQVLGTTHIETAVSHNHLGLLKLAEGDVAAARQHIYACLEIRRRLLDQTASVQNERQQLAMNQLLRIALDDWLSVVEDETAYAEVLRWKGTVFVRQATLRALRGQPELKPLVDALQSTCSRFAKLSMTVPEDAEKHRDELMQVGMLREQLESQLASESELYRISREQAELTPAGLQQFIAQNENTALVDILEYKKYAPPTASHASPRERRFVAFVLRGSGPAIRIELGAAERIDELVDAFRDDQLQNPLGSTASLSRSGQQLRQYIWQPLGELLDGVQTVLISPDGSLGKLPFAALPGRMPETYLLEDFATAVIPVPQMLPWLLSDEELPEVDGNVLVLGGVDYDVAGSSAAAKPKKRFGRRPRVPASPAVTAGPQNTYATRLDPWSPIDATKSELASIKKTYEDIFGTDGISTLEAAGATEAEFRKQASRHRYLHVATHGFFAPAELVSALENRDETMRGTGGGESKRFTGYNPGLLSGLVLAGANNPSEDGDDGVLTALEVAELDLTGVDLAVLSACQTGLGRVAGGEGLLGLQRSFQVAGARSVVASLWSVPDTRTSSLMSSFYDNLWNKDMGRLKALHAAQLSMLNDTDRGVRVSKPDAAERNPRTPPYLWAAFILSGDWRF